MQDPEEFSKPPIAPFLAALLVLEGLALALTLTVSLQGVPKDVWTVPVPLAPLFLLSGFFRGPLAALPYLPVLWFAAYWFWDRDRRPKARRLSAEDIIAPPPWKDEARHRDRLVRWTARIAFVVMLGLLMTSCALLFHPSLLMTTAPPATPSSAPPVPPALPPR